MDLPPPHPPQSLSQERRVSVLSQSQSCFLVDATSFWPLGKLLSSRPRQTTEARGGGNTQWGRKRPPPQPQENAGGTGPPVLRVHRPGHNAGQLKGQVVTDAWWFTSDFLLPERPGDSTGKAQCDWRLRGIKHRSDLGEARGLGGFRCPS